MESAPFASRLMSISIMFSFLAVIMGAARTVLLNANIVLFVEKK